MTKPAPDGHLLNRKKKIQEEKNEGNIVFLRVRVIVTTGSEECIIIRYFFSHLHISYL